MKRIATFLTLMLFLSIAYAQVLDATTSTPTIHDNYEFQILHLNTANNPSYTVDTNSNALWDFSPYFVAANSTWEIMHPSQAPLIDSFSGVNQVWKETDKLFAYTKATNEALYTKGYYQVDTNLSSLYTLRRFEGDGVPWITFPLTTSSDTSTYCDYTFESPLGQGNVSTGIWSQRKWVVGSGTFITPLGVQYDNVLLIKSEINMNSHQDSTIDDRHFMYYSAELNFHLAFGRPEHADSTFSQLHMIIVLDTSNSTLSNRAPRQGSEFSIFPNPTSNFIRFSKSITGEINLRDLSGKTVLSNHLSGQTEITIGALPSGIYNVTIDDEGNTHNQLLVIEG